MAEPSKLGLQLLETAQLLVYNTDCCQYCLVEDKEQLLSKQLVLSRQRLERARVRDSSELLYTAHNEFYVYTIAKRSVRRIGRRNRGRWEM